MDNHFEHNGFFYAKGSSWRDDKGRIGHNWLRYYPDGGYAGDLFVPASVRLSGPADLASRFPAPLKSAACSACGSVYYGPCSCADNGCQ